MDAKGIQNQSEISVIGIAKTVVNITKLFNLLFVQAD